MTPRQVPDTMSDWMRLSDKRILSLERRRQGGVGSGDGIVDIRVGDGFNGKLGSTYYTTVAGAPFTGLDPADWHEVIDDAGAGVETLPRMFRWTPNPRSDQTGAADQTVPANAPGWNFASIALRNPYGTRPYMVMCGYEVDVDVDVGTRMTRITLYSEVYAELSANPSTDNNTRPGRVAQGSYRYVPTGAHENFRLAATAAFPVPSGLNLRLSFNLSWVRVGDTSGGVDGIVKALYSGDYRVTWVALWPLGYEVLKYPNGKWPYEDIVGYTPPSGYPTLPPAKVGSLRTDFSAMPAWLDIRTNATASAGRLNLPATTSAASAQTSQAYDLTASALTVETFRVPVTASGAIAHVTMTMASASNSFLRFIVSSGSLQAVYSVAGTNYNQVVGTFNPTAHKWWRIREAGGVVYWDLSPDGVTWTQAYSHSSDFAVTALTIRFATVVSSGTDGSFEIDSMGY